MEKQKEEQCCFTEKQKNGIINNNSNEFFESLMLSLILLVGAATIICNKFSAVTSIVYIVPCAVSSAARMARIRYMEPVFKIHFLGFIIATIVIIGMVWLQYLKCANSMVHIVLFLYPIYEGIYTVYQKYIGDITEVEK